MRVVSWNVRGLGTPQKRSAVLRHLKQLQADIALLQETLLRVEDFPQMEKQWVGKAVGSPSGGRRAGVIVLLNKLPCTITEMKTDEDGQLLTIWLKMEDSDLAIANVYFPNSPSHADYASLSQWPSGVDSSHHIVGGDFNYGAF